MKALATFVLSTLALSTHAQMTATDCQHLTNAAQGIMKLRQEGVAYDQLKTEATKIVDTQQQRIFMQLLNDAFQTPMLQDQQQKAQTIMNFSQKYKTTCTQ